MCTENAKCYVSPFPGLPRTDSDKERRSQEVVRPPEGNASSPSKEGEYILVTPIKGVDKEGRLILGDPKILSASALKI